MVSSTAVRAAFAASYGSMALASAVQSGQFAMGPISTTADSSLPAVARKCIADNVVCLDKHAANLPYPFYREPPNGTTYTNIGDTDVPTAEKDWGLVRDAQFVVYNEERAKSILGKSPKVELKFEVSPYLHESPVYVPSLKRLYFSELSNNLPQYVVDLSVDPPRLETFVADPPIFVPNGGFYHKGLIYFSTAGSNQTVAGGSQQRPGIVTLDPNTNKSSTLLDNYFGLAFTGCDDVVVDPRTGHVWFTVPYYSWWLEIADVAPQLRSGTFRFDPSSGATVIVNDDMRSPNGIALSPDGKTMYISDTAAAGLSAPISMDIPSPGIPGILFNATGIRTVYKFDVIDQGRGIINKRPIHYDALGTVPDGLKVAKNGLVVTASGNGLTVFDEFGELVVRAQTNFLVNNFQWTDHNGWTDVWMVGQGGVGKVSWNLEGVPVSS